MASHYLVKLTNDTGVVRYIRNRGTSGVEHAFTINEYVAYRFPSRTQAEEAAGQYQNVAWTVEIIEM